MHSASCLYQNLRKYIDQSKVFGFFNKEDFAKTKSLDQRLPPLRKKIWSYPQYYSTIDDEHKCVGYSSVLFDSSCVTYIETFISEKLVQIYDLTFVKLNDQFCYLVIITAFDFGVFPTGRNYRQKTKYRQKCDCLVTSVNHPYICQDKPAKELCTIAF